VKEVNILPVPHLGNGFEIQVENEDYTFGNMIHCWINKQCADYSLDPSERTLESITYHKPHPLMQRIVFTVKPISSADYMTVVQTIIKKSCEDFVKFIESILTELTETSQYIAEVKTILNRP
jgi:DNA-directed RNA polymerase subunit L